MLLSAVISDFKSSYTLLITARKLAACLSILLVIFGLRSVAGVLRSLAMGVNPSLPLLLPSHSSLEAGTPPTDPFSCETSKSYNGPRSRKRSICLRFGASILSARLKSIECAVFDAFGSFLSRVSSSALALFRCASRILVS